MYKMNNLWKCSQGFSSVVARCRPFHVTTHLVRNSSLFSLTPGEISAAGTLNSNRTTCQPGKRRIDRDNNGVIARNRGLHTHAPCHQKVLSNVSSHLPSVRQMEQFLSSKSIRFDHGHTAILAQCSFCSKHKKKGDKPDLSLFINKTTGSHFCRNCGASGSWRQFKDAVSDKLNKHNVSNVSQETPIATSSREEESKVAQLWNESFLISKYHEDQRKLVVDRFALQNLSAATLDMYQVHLTKHKFSEQDGSVKEHLCVAFPWYDSKKHVVRGVKLVKTDPSSDNQVTLQPRQGFLGLFGWNTIKADAKEVVLTLNEFDAMAIHQATSYPAISLPLGTHSLPPEVLPQLEQFERIILWFGSDVRSKQAANQFSRKLNIQRCHFVRPTEKNPPTGALDALNKGYDLQKLITSAQPISHDKIITFHQLRNEVYSELVNADQVAGVKWSRFPKLTSILKGHRRGELTIFTGPTGAGKTTLLSELSIDLCQSGVNTLWGSFEIRNVRLIKAMLNQLSGMNVQKNVHQFSYWADKFEMLPMYFMSFFGSQDVSSVVETMAHAAYVYDIDHIIIDNLQFMTSNVRSDDRYSVHNQAIAAFRDFASTKNVHVTLVIHPRKENDDVELQTASIFGTAKASQEADNVMILQDKRGKSDKYLQITKNRFDGSVGRVPLEFVKDSLSMSGFGKTQTDLRRSSQQKKIPAISISGPAPDSSKKTHSSGNNTPVGDTLGRSKPTSNVTPPKSTNSAPSHGGATTDKAQTSSAKPITNEKGTIGPISSAKTPQMYKSFQGRIVSQVKAKKASEVSNSDEGGAAGNEPQGESVKQPKASPLRWTKRLPGAKLNANVLGAQQVQNRMKKIE